MIIQGNQILTRLSAIIAVFSSVHSAMITSGRLQEFGSFRVVKELTLIESCTGHEANLVAFKKGFAEKSENWIRYFISTSQSE
jgi:hypothetical protein